MATETRATATPRAGRREWVGLAVLALPTLLVSLDLFVVLLAAPHLSAALHATSTQQLWILDIYGFMVAGLLITMGTLGDRIGRRRLLLMGAAAFGAASLLAAYSMSAPMLIAARALLGIAGATLTPSTLSLIMNLFADPRERARAMGIWAGCFVAGAIIGPIVGGALLDRFWWGSVFLLGVPAMVLLLATGRKLLPEYRNPDAGRLDPISVGLSLAAIMATIYGLKELSRNGWQPVPLSAMVVGLVLGVVFVRRQRGLTDPLLDLHLFASRAFAATLGSLLANSMLAGGIMVFVAQHFQLVEGLSPLQAGLALVPGMAAAIVSFQLAPILARRVRPAFLFSGGLVLSVVGMLVLTQAGAGSGTAVLVVGFVLVSFGGGPLVALGTNLVVSSAPQEKAGSAAGLAQTGNELGYALGIATLGSIGTLVYRTQVTDAIPAGVPASVASAVRDTLAGATAAAQALPRHLASELLTPAREAYTSGLRVVAVVAAIVLAAVALLIVAALREVAPIGREDQAAEGGG